MEIIIKYQQNCLYGPRRTGLNLRRLLMTSGDITCIGRNNYVMFLTISAIFTSNNLLLDFNVHIYTETAFDQLITKT